MADRPDHLAETLFGADWSGALAECRDDPDLAGEVSRRLADKLGERTRPSPGGANAEGAVRDMQKPLMELAEVPGADADLLANFVILVAVRPDCDRVFPTDLDEATLEWVMRQVAWRTRALIEEERDRGTDAGLSPVGLLKRAILRHRAEASGEPDSPSPEASWTFSRMVDAGTAFTPSGEISCGSPWADYGPDISVSTDPGRYPVKLAIAESPSHGPENAAALLRIGGGEPVSWAPLESELPQWRGYEAAAGIGGFGATAAYRLVLEELPDELFADPHPGQLEMDGGDGGSIVAFTVGPQDQDCRTWVGLDEAGVPAALVTDLGLLDLDPDRNLPAWLRI